MRCKVTSILGACARAKDMICSWCWCGGFNSLCVDFFRFRSTVGASGSPGVGGEGLGLFVFYEYFFLVQ